MNTQRRIDTARAMVADDQGLLARSYRSGGAMRAVASQAAVKH